MLLLFVALFVVFITREDCTDYHMWTFWQSESSGSFILVRISGPHRLGGGMRVYRFTMRTNHRLIWSKLSWWYQICLMLTACDLHGTCRVWDYIFIPAAQTACSQWELVYSKLKWENDAWIYINDSMMERNSCSVVIVKLMLLYLVLFLMRCTQLYWKVYSPLQPLFFGA